MERAILAGGCFWCIEAAFMGVYGVEKACSGYVGEGEAPSYEEVCSGSGHVEAVSVWFDPEKISYLQILEIFWRHIDPIDAGGQFHDRGKQYKTAIFCLDANQKRLAQESLNFVQSLFSETIATHILDEMPFYDAEEKHQKYCTKQPAHYNTYNNGHVGRLSALWEGKPPLHANNLEEYLTPMQYKVTKQQGTEPPFDNPYFDNHGEGVYVDIISGEPLFSSESKFDSGTGWPSFYAPINPEALVEHEDTSLGTTRIEIRAEKSGAHLGHVFPDGPPPTHLRYCMNSAALRFIPKKS